MRWPAAERERDEPPVFLVSREGLERLGDVLTMVQRFGRYFGAVRLRLLEEVVGGTGSVAGWFSVKKSWKPEMELQKHVRVSEGDEGLGVVQNWWPEPCPGNRRPQLKTVAAQLIKCEEKGEFGNITVEEHWAEVRSGSSPQKVYKYFVDITGKWNFLIFLTNS